MTEIPHDYNFGFEIKSSNTGNDRIREFILPTVQGGDLKISKSKEDGLSIDNANVIADDLLAINGVIHVIDAVVIPKS